MIQQFNNIAVLLLFLTWMWIPSKRRRKEEEEALLAELVSSTNNTAKQDKWSSIASKDAATLHTTSGAAGKKDVRPGWRFFDNTFFVCLKKR